MTNDPNYLGRRGHVLLLHRHDGELPAQRVHAHVVGARGGLHQGGEEAGGVGEAREPEDLG